MNAAPPDAGRWMNYILRSGSDFLPFWESLLGSKRRNLLFVVGRGFDPRMCNGVEQVLSLGGDGLRHCVLVEYDEGETSPSRAHDDLLNANVSTLQRLLQSPDAITVRRIKMWSDDGRRRIGSRGAAEVFISPSEFAGYSDILVDISALPRSLYMPLLAKLLYLIDGLGTEPHPNLHVLTIDYPDLDRLITAEGLSDDAVYIHGFESGIEQEATADVPKVWMPILGEGKIGHFERIYDLVVPDEIAPVVPFPCVNPRRTDNLVLEYRRYLFDQFRIEPSNFIYVPEQNPFGVYREISAAVRHYAEALHALGGCKIVISALSSKLLSLGALLAAYELKQAEQPVGIAHVHAVGYSIRNESPPDLSGGDLFEAWIAGEPYDLS